MMLSATPLNMSRPVEVLTVGGAVEPAGLKPEAGKRRSSHRKRNCSESWMNQFRHASVSIHVGGWTTLSLIGGGAKPRGALSGIRLLLRQPQIRAHKPPGDRIGHDDFKHPAPGCAKTVP